MKKKILLIAYNFPPIGGARGIRWYQLLKYLSKNFSIDVLTIQPEKGYGNYDGSFLSKIPKNVRIFRTYPGPLHYFTYHYFPTEKINKVRIKSFKKNLRRQIKDIYKNALEVFFVPDKMIEWLPLGLKKANVLISHKKYDLIISSAAPFTDHLIGYFLKKTKGIPWISDYGDPWAFNSFSPFPWRRYLIDRQIEKKLLKKMDRIIVTTKKTAESYIKHYPFLNLEKFIVIPFGYDSEEFQDIKAEKGEKFRIVYTGIFYKDRSPDEFFKLIKSLDFDFELVIAGDINQEYIKTIQDFGLNNKVVFLGHQSHQRAIALQKGADILLLMGWAKGQQIPAKIFEYIGARRPILAIKFDEKDLAAKLIQKHNRGISVHNNTEDIISALREMHSLWLRGKLDSFFELKEVKEYSWEYSAERLTRVIEYL